MEIRILAVGDVCGEPGMSFLSNRLKEYISDMQISFTVVNGENANVVGLLISVDRKEKLENGKSALQTVQDEYGIEAHSIVNINDIITFLESEDNRNKINAPEGILDKVYAYREKWGAQ